MPKDRAGVTAPTAWAWSEVGMGDDGSFVLPTGTVAFLLTDIERSTRAWEAEPEAMAAALDLHNRILDRAVSARGGVCPPAQGEGDSIVAAFSRASDAVLAARDAQRELAAATWPTTSPVRVRMAVHAGEARFVDDGNYAGHAIIRTARLRAVAHGGQVLVSASAHDLTVDQLGDAVSFRDLGEHRLKDLARPERVWQLTGAGLEDEFEPLASLDRHPHNLPVELSTYVGRVDETRTLVRLMGTERLITITGAGGAGKTRLAQRVAAELLESLDAGAWWIELAPLTAGDEIPGAIARATDTKAEIGADALEALVERLGGLRLLVLDNCEHLVDDVASLVALLLRRCPDLRILATSREPLAVDGELAWRIPPLGVPPAASGDPMPVESLGQYDAVRLFLDRAQRVRPNFHLDDVTGPVIADICQRLDGIPLAIELAASRCRSLRPQQIRDGLTESLNLLTGGTRAGIGRQQTLAASMTWSHDLLSPTEQILFRRLAAFRGGCSLDDAEPVVSDDDLASTEVLDLLDRLVAQSLLVAEDAGPVQRYQMLETVRQFAIRKLDEAGERPELEARHAEHFVAKLERVGPTLECAFDVEDLRWSVEEMENLDRAIRTIADQGAIERAGDACWHLALAWGLVDPPACERLLTHLLDLTIAEEGSDPGIPHAKLLMARAHLCMWSGDLLQSAIDATEGLALAEEIVEPALALRARAYLAQVVVWVDPDEGIRLHHRALDDARSQGDLVVEILALTGIGGAHAGIASELSLGRQPLDEAVERAEALGNPLLQAWADSQQAVACAFSGDLDAAEAWASAGERRLRTVGAAIGARELRLTQGNVVGGVITFAQAYARSQRADGSSWLLSLPEMAARAAAAGYLLTPSLLEVSYAVTMAHRGDYAAAEQALERCRETAERSGAEATVVNAAAYWCDLALAAGHLEEAKRRLATVEHRALAIRSMHARVRLGLRRAAIALIEGEIDAAEREAHDALSICVREGIAWETFHALEVLAQVATITDSPAEAARIAGTVGAIRARHDINVRLAWHAERFDHAVIVARESLGDEVFEQCYAEGSALSTAEAAAYVQRARGERKRPSFGWDGLTPTEREVVGHVAEGRTNPQIAEAMFISRETVKTHLSHIFAKLDVSSRSELAAAAVRREATR